MGAARPERVVSAPSGVSRVHLTLHRQEDGPEQHGYHRRRRRGGTRCEPPAPGHPRNTKRGARARGKACAAGGSTWRSGAGSRAGRPRGGQPGWTRGCSRGPGGEETSAHLGRVSGAWDFRAWEQTLSGCWKGPALPSLGAGRTLGPRPAPRGGKPAYFWGQLPRIWRVSPARLTLILTSSL